MKNQILHVDIDSVVFPLMECIIPKYNKAYNDNLTHDDFLNYDVRDTIKSECKHLFQEFLTPELYEEAVPYNGAIECIDYLHKNYQLYFLTSSHPNQQEHRDKWLEKYFKWYSSSQLIMCRNKHLVKGDILIDDNVDNLTGWNGKRILYTCSWNKKFKESQIGAKRIDGWNNTSLAVIDYVAENKYRLDEKLKALELAV